MRYTFSRYLTGPLTLCILVMCLATSPLSAQTTNNTQCARLGLLVGIVDITALILNAENRRLPQRFDALETLANTIKPYRIQNLLRQAGHSHSTRDVDAYLSDLNRFLQVRQTNGPAYGNWILNQQSFQQRHIRMRELTEKLCPLGAIDQTFDVLDTAATQLGHSNPQQLVASELKALQQLKPGRIKTSNNWSGPFIIRKEVLMLLQVFFVLASALLTLFTVNYLIKLSRAIRLDRFACTIPATLETDGISFAGHIDVLGNRGVSFQITEALTRLHHDTLTLDRHVTFVTDALTIKAVLTKPFDGSAGFRLTVPLNKSKLRSLLTLSTSKPHRKLEMGKKKKPAIPIKVSLALKSRSDPAR